MESSFNQEEKTDEEKSPFDRRIYSDYSFSLQEKKETAQVVPIEKPSKSDNREELDFQFDEELPTKHVETAVLPSGNRRRTKSLTLDPHEDEYVHQIQLISI